MLYGIFLVAPVTNDLGHPGMLPSSSYRQQVSWEILKGKKNVTNVYTTYHTASYKKQQMPAEWSVVAQVTSTFNWNVYYLSRELRSFQDCPWPFGAHWDISRGQEVIYQWGLHENHQTTTVPGEHFQLWVESTLLCCTLFVYPLLSDMTVSHLQNVSHVSGGAAEEVKEESSCFSSIR